MAYYFLLDKFPLPVPPSALNIKTPSMNKTVTLINDGEINIPKLQGLREISFDFLIPSVQKYPFATYHLGTLNASTWIVLLKLLKENALPVSLIVARMSPSGKFNYFTCIRCLIEDLEFKEDAEEYGLDTMCSITMKEYKPYQTKRVELKEATSAKPGSAKKAKVVNTRDSSSKVKSSTLKTSGKDTIVSAAKKNGDSVAQSVNLNHIKPIDIGNGQTVTKSLDIGNVDLSQWTQPTFEGLDTSGNVVLGGTKTQQVSSFGDTILLGTPPSTYKSPSIYESPGTGNIIEKITSQGFDWTNIASGI